MPPFPALAPVVEELLATTAAVDPGLVAASTHLRPSSQSGPAVVSNNVRHPGRRTPLLTTCSVLVVLALGGTAFGAYRITGAGAGRVIQLAAKLIW